LNLYGLLHWILSPARLPIPPRGRGTPENGVKLGEGSEFVEMLG
jgi:hypothetical protein